MVSSLGALSKIVGWAGSLKEDWAAEGVGGAELSGVVCGGVGGGDM